MSDAFSIADCHQGHGYTRDEAESAAAALRAGCDLEIGRCYRSLAEARQRNLIHERTSIDRSPASCRSAIGWACWATRPPPPARSTSTRTRHSAGAPPPARYFTGEPVFPFGFGLSYSRFTYRGLELDEEAITTSGRLAFSFEIGNDSDIAGEEVIQIYFSAQDAGTDTPQCQLVGFERCHFAARETKRFVRTVGSDELALVDADGTRAPRPGRYTLYVSASSPGQRARALGVPQLSARFAIRE